MDRELLKDHFKKSQFTAVQADALANIFSDIESRLTTKADMAALRTETKADMAALRTETKAEMVALRSEMKAELSRMRADLSDMEARLTWRIIAVVVFLGTVMTLVGHFAG